MNKQEFLTKLRKGLYGLPYGDIEERISFYSEMIDDRIEDGISEEQAVCEIGNVEEIISQIVADTPFTQIVKERIKPKRRLSAWEIIFLVLGSPIWLSLLIALFAVIFSVYISLWSVIVSLWAAFVSVVGCAVGGIIAGILFTCSGSTHAGIAMLGAGMVCAGFSVFAFFGCRAATKGILLITKKLAVWIKNCFIKKEDA